MGVSAVFIQGGNLNTNTEVTPAGEWKTYLDQEIAANNAAEEQAEDWSAAFLVQLAAYFLLWDDAIDNRNDVLDKQEEFLAYLEATERDVDFPQIQLKQTVLTDLTLPELNPCADPLKFVDENVSDGLVVDTEASKQSRSACGGVPAGWDLHEGLLRSHAAASYAGGLMHNANKRRREGFRVNKTALVQRAQSAGNLAVGPILAGYQQAAAVHEGLASIFLQGFQSAGAGLGVSLERMTTAGSGVQ